MLLSKIWSETLLLLNFYRTSRINALSESAQSLNIRYLLGKGTGPDIQPELCIRDISKQVRNQI